MSDVAIHVDGLWKKFRKGEVHDSLREFIPAMMKRLLGRSPLKSELRPSEFWALKDISFEVEKGESLGIIGPNGAGKSTMLKVLSRILKPNRGSYQVQGRLASLIEVGAGFHPDLTGRENIYLNGTILGMKRQEIKSLEEKIIDFAGIDGFIDTPVKRYSSGMGARLGFSIAAHLRADVLLVDEVLSVGDARFRHKCVRYMNTLLRSGITVIFISHILDQVRALCPQTLVLHKGEIAYQGETDGAIRSYLDLLAINDQPGEAGESSTAQVSNIRLCDAEGNEVLEWTVGKPGYVEFDLLVRIPYHAVHVAVNISTMAGAYVGTIHSNAKGPASDSIVKSPGHFRIRLEMAPMPLADGDFGMEIQVFGGQKGATPKDYKYRNIWSNSQPRVLPVRGSEPSGQVVNLTGQWMVSPLEPEVNAIDAQPVVHGTVV